MVRAFVLYEGEVDPERYQRHVEEFAKASADVAR